MGCLLFCDGASYDRADPEDRGHLAELAPLAPGIAVVAAIDTSARGEDRVGRRRGMLTVHMAEFG
jgi:hypothetical protein